MKNSTVPVSASRFVYFIVIVVALLQGLTLNATSDYLIRSSWQLPGSLVWLPMLLALFVPTVFSYLSSRFSSAALWTGLVLTAALCVWMNYWYLSEATAGHTRELSSLIPLLVLLFWLILPWFQLWQSSGSRNPDYALLTEQYVRNTVLGALAGLIGLLVMGMLHLAVYLFRIVNLEFLSGWLDDSLYYWISFCLGFNVSLVFVRSVFSFSTGKIAGYVARVLLPLLTVIGVIAAGGLLLSVVTGVRVSGLGSFTMIWFVALNIILLNLVYGNECVPRFRSWLSALVLAGVLLLNVFSLSSVYGILVRVNQYSWSMDRLYGFSIALFLAVVVLAYSVALLWKRSGWVVLLGPVNKAGLLALMAVILVISSPLADFKQITANSILAGIEKGRIKVTSDIRYTLEGLGKRGEAVLTVLNDNPEYRKALTYSSYDQDNRRTLQEVLLTVPGSPELPESWWEGKPDVTRSWFCTETSANGECLGFMADADGDGQDEAVVCITGYSDTSLYCQIWQQTTEAAEGEPDKLVWTESDYQDIQYASEADQQAAWAALKAGHYLLKPKKWMMVTPEPPVQ
ncbi:DUF4153 domain-containing protein [Morganella morganii]|uniref:DUF7057 domain-containing protein n=1 Tax=Morganella morganii TaxID=582 RepID=UPI000D1F8086|nr:DUF4153 domain-containing protein [Morganella morganii]HAE76543.1 DUF4153 domain-containing protein [Morganella sp. (in: enterobacteria)]QXO42098.1 DUF4153 domain-containing protein [Morganella morganii]QXO45729.1 DUF4153 domain-containing protein [Morganella morganii]QXO49390.1 DUF4153 domain-containing protein [Morganella morganii]QXO53250.1 DUF4153 domain-containing protein [Morganella morganii]